jgi:hypothetical protein
MNTPRGATYYTRDSNERPETMSINGRVTSITYEAGFDNRATMSVGDVSTQFGYDSAGRLASRIDTVGSQVFRTSFEYDNNDNLITIKYPSLTTTPRRQIGFDCDSENRPADVPPPDYFGVAFDIAAVWVDRRWHASMWSHGAVAFCGRQSLPAQYRLAPCGHPLLKVEVPQVFGCYQGDITAPKTKHSSCKVIESAGVPQHLAGVLSAVLRAPYSNG